MTDIAPTPHESFPPKRSWRRFTLRALLLVVLAVGIIFGWLAYRVRAFHEQAAHVDDLRLRGFRVVVQPTQNNSFWYWLAGDKAFEVVEVYAARFDPETHTYGGPTADDIDTILRWQSLQSLTLAGIEVNDAALDRMSSLTRLEMLRLMQPAITDKGTEHLSELHSLKELSIDNAPPSPRNEHDRLVPLSITTIGLKNIASLPHLTRLHIGPARLNDKDLAVVAQRLPNLDGLALFGTDITNEGLAHLRKLPRLIYVGLNDNHLITDCGLRHLRHLPLLEGISLSGTRVTPEAVRALIQAVPMLARRYGSDGSSVVLGLDDPFDNQFKTDKN